jgi:hypothetical protein
LEELDGRERSLGGGESWSRTVRTRDGAVSPTENPITDQGHHVPALLLAVRARLDRPPRPGVGAAAALLAIVAASSAQSASAQVITYTSRNGQNTAFCGPIGGGPLVHHQFSDAGRRERPDLDLRPGRSSVVAEQTRRRSTSPTSRPPASRSWARAAPLATAAGGFGTGATADTRDEWEFTVSAPVHVTSSPSLSANSTAPAAMPVQTYTLGGLGGGAAIIPDPGLRRAPSRA